MSREAVSNVSYPVAPGTTVLLTIDCQFGFGAGSWEQVPHADTAVENLAAITGNFSVLDLDVGDTLTPSIVGTPVVQLNNAAFVLPAGATALTAAGAFTLTGATSNGSTCSPAPVMIPTGSSNTSSTSPAPA